MNKETTRRGFIVRSKIKTWYILFAFTSGGIPAENREISDRFKLTKVYQ